LFTGLSGRSAIEARSLLLDWISTVFSVSYQIFFVALIDVVWFYSRYGYRQRMYVLSQCSFLLLLQYCSNVVQILILVLHIHHSFIANKYEYHPIIYFFTTSTSRVQSIKECFRGDRLTYMIHTRRCALGRASDIDQCQEENVSVWPSLRLNSSSAPM